MTFNEATSNIDTRDLTSLIEKSKRVLVLAYIAMTHQRYKNDVKKTIKETDPKKLSEELNKKINEQITYRLDTLQRECKYNDLSRAKREAGLWKEFITKIISETNRGIWMSGTDGRKYKSIVEEFEKLVSDILGEAKQTITPEKIEPVKTEPQSTETGPEMSDKNVYSFDLVNMEQFGFMPKLGGAGSARETSGWSATCKVSDEKEFERLKKNNFNVELVLSSPNKTLHGTKLIISDELKKQINTHYFGGPVFEGTTKDGKSPSFNNPLIVTKVSVWMSKIDASSKSSTNPIETTSNIPNSQKERFLRMREKRNKRLGNPVPEVTNKKVEPVEIKRFDSLA